MSGNNGAKTIGKLRGLDTGVPNFASQIRVAFAEHRLEHRLQLAGANWKRRAALPRSRSAAPAPLRGRAPRLDASQLLFKIGTRLTLPINALSDLRSG